MKFIGQYIQGLIARFRNDVYLEDLSTTTETTALVVDSNGKISKNVTSGVNMTNGADNRVVTAVGTNGLRAESHMQFVAEDSYSNLQILDFVGTFGHDYFEIQVDANGVTTLKTVDNSHALAHFEIEADGNITLDAAGAIALEANTTVTGDVITTGNIELGHASDTTIARSAAGTVTIEGKQVVTENKQLQAFSSNFFDDIVTTKHYIPISTQQISEQTSDGNTITDFLVPCNTKVKEVMVKLPRSTTGSGDLTIGIETSDIGASPTSKSVIETETVTVADSNDNDIVHFMFDDTTHATIGKNLSITIQAASDLSGSQNWYVVAILEFDWSTRHTSSSAIQTS